MAGCDVLYHDPAHAGPGDGWRPCSARGAVWTDPDLVLRFVCSEHRRQLTALHAAGLADRIRWARDGLTIATPTPHPRKLPVREHTTSVHLMLDPTDPGQLDIGARQHPELPDTFYVDLDSLRCDIAISGPAEPVLAVVERMRAELVAALAAAGRSDLTSPGEEAEPRHPPAASPGKEAKRRVMVYSPRVA